MRSWFVVCLALANLALGCDGSEVAAAEELQQVVVEASSLEGLGAAYAPSAVAGRQVLFGDVAHYRFRVRVGSGEHDFVTLHRVVREDAAWRPARTGRSVFMVHGDGWGFEAAFLSSVGSAHVPEDHSIAAYLAKEGVDVWGIDLRWVGVPTDTQDFSFMADWTLGTACPGRGQGAGGGRARCAWRRAAAR
ncbi:hypothetical protein ACLESD_48915, partial [Pyxidicoccus sp. 3LFB2]